MLYGFSPQAGVAALAANQLMLPLVLGTVIKANY